MKSVGPIIVLAALVLARCGVQPALADNVPGKIVQSWLANSFANAPGHQSVPVSVCGICVTPDGTVFSAGVAEGYGGVASYKDGQFVTKYDYDSGFGSSSLAVAADSDYVYIGTEAGLFRTRRGDEGFNRTPVVPGKFYGLALSDGELDVSDYDASKIRVFTTITMQEARSFPAPSPGPLTVSIDGRIWVIQGQPAKEPYLSYYTGGLKIVSFNRDGQPSREITDFENPCALAIDPSGRLVVGGLNQHPCEGLDARNNPIYRRSSEITFTNPPEFAADRLRRVFYIPEDDVLIVGGSPGTEENACNLLMCFDHWSDPGRRAKRWSIDLSLNDKAYTPDTGYGGGAPVAMHACGKYLFVAYGYGYVRVHQLNDGRYVGTIRPDINGFSGSGGCVDSDNALTVNLRQNGEYVVFLENAGWNHVMMFRWTPEAGAP